jgi:hypothetical protein
MRFSDGAEGRYVGAGRFKLISYGGITQSTIRPTGR